MEFAPTIPGLTSRDLEELRNAKALLENPTFAGRLASLLGGPVERGFRLLPKRWAETVHTATKAALLKAIQTAVSTLGSNRPRKSSERLHKVLVAASGGVGGIFGLAALPIELPISTTIMLRSIADIARSEGQDLDHVETRLNCLEVFALGGQSPRKTIAESSYWTVRTALARALTEAASFIVEKGIVEESAPAVTRFLTAIASRFGSVVSEQMAAKAVPLVGAASGAAINLLFIGHFQAMARGHFVIKRLEEKHGMDLIRQAYESLGISFEA
jgi:hypothetical protein